jgi:hypothetical protein
MGLLDLPDPALTWADARLALLLPAGTRIVAWGIIAGVLSLAVYWLASPQQRMASMAAEEKRLKAALQDENLEMSDGMAAAGALLRLAVQRLGLVLLPVLLAAVPVLVLMAWLGTHYGHDLRFLSFGPDWARGWEVPFIAALFAATLVLRSLLRIK